MNSTGKIFRLTIYGESHGPGIGIIIDGCPPGIPLEESDFSTDLARRQAGAKGTTRRVEEDKPRFISGIFNGYTSGAPLHIMFENKLAQPADYDPDIPRPGHADHVAGKKYKGYHDYRGGGHFSGRLTAGIVAAGVIAKKIIPGIKIKAELIQAGGVKHIESAIDKAMSEGDSIGGIVECRAVGVPVGLGEPFFDPLESQISHLCFAIPGIKGVEFGSGFQAARMKGSEHNDVILPDGSTGTNHAGGINGGISNGNELYFRVAVKPTSSIARKQTTANIKTGKMVDLEIQGRHDTCFALRVPVIIEAITAVVLVDNLLMQG
jgi:chorismate synthase